MACNIPKGVAMNGLPKPETPTCQTSKTIPIANNLIFKLVLFNWVSKVLGAIKLSMR
jgi:hypothetical protein